MTVEFRINGVKTAIHLSPKTERDKRLAQIFREAAGNNYIRLLAAPKDSPEDLIFDVEVEQEKP